MVQLVHDLDGSVYRAVGFAATTALHTHRVPLASIAHVAVLSLRGEPDAGIPRPDCAVMALSDEG